MKQFFGALIVTISVSIFGICQTEMVGKNLDKNLQNEQGVKKCAENSDSLYNRQRVLKQLADALNRSVPEYRRIFPSGFQVENERGVGFFIYDLTETSNKGTPLYDCVNFKNNHVYHFAPIKHHYSLSHIVILNDGELKIFNSVNCKDRGDNIEDVISYLSQKLMNEKDKDEILSRVKDYRKYGIYITVDDTSLVCEEIKTDKKSN